MIINYKALIYKHALLVYDHLSDIIASNPQVHQHIAITL